MQSTSRVAKGCPLPPHKRPYRCRACPLNVDERIRQCKWFKGIRDGYKNAIKADPMYLIHQKHEDFLAHIKPLKGGVTSMRKRRKERVLCDECGEPIYRSLYECYYCGGKFHRGCMLAKGSGYGIDIKTSAKHFVHGLIPQTSSFLYCPRCGTQIPDRSHPVFRLG